MEVKLGYMNAYEYLQNYIEEKVSDQKDKALLLDVLHDFGYCTKMAKKAEKFTEALMLIREAEETEE